VEWWPIYFCLSLWKVGARIFLGRLPFVHFFVFHLCMGLSLKGVSQTAAQTWHATRHFFCIKYPFFHSGEKAVVVVFLSNDKNATTLITA
jgi:hypothetical protein